MILDSDKETLTFSHHQYEPLRQEYEVTSNYFIHHWVHLGLQVVNRVQIHFSKNHPVTF